MYPSRAPFLFGIHQVGVGERDEIMKKLSYVGHIKIQPGFDANGARSGVSKISDFANEFLNLEQHGKIFGFKKFPVTLIYSKAADPSSKAPDTSPGDFSRN
jgi:hypothetical protein